MAEIIAVGAHTRDAFLLVDKIDARLLQGRKGLANALDLALQAAESIEQCAMARGINQRAVVMLSVDLDERGRNGAKRLDADWLVVDEGTRAAISHLNAAENEISVAVDVLRGGRDPGGMIRAKIEHRRDLTLRFAGANQRAIATAAKGERKRIQQDGFARAGFSGENGEAPTKLKVEAIDQDNIADR
jgi:hypothetical protein